MDVAAEAEFAGFVARRHRSLTRSAFVLVGDAGRAEDLVQDAMYKTFLAWDRLAASSAAESYARTTMVRPALRWRERRWTRETSSADLPDVVETVDDRIEIGMDVWRALRRMSVEQRAVLVLRYLEDLSEAETAAVLRCSVGTVKSRASRALVELRSSGLFVDDALDGDVDEEVPRG